MKTSKYTLIAISAISISCAPDSPKTSKPEAPQWELTDKKPVTTPNENYTFCHNATELKHSNSLHPIGAEYVYMNATFSHYGSFDKNQNYSYCLSIKDLKGKERNFLVNKETYFENEGSICWNETLVEPVQVCFSHRSNSFQLRWYIEELNNIPYDFMDNFLVTISDTISEVNVSINRPEKNTIIMKGGLIPEDKLCSRETVGKSCKYPGFVLCKTTPCEAEHCDVFNCKVKEGIGVRPGPVD